MNKRFNSIFPAILCAVLIVLYINSTVWFRLKLADFYKGHRQYSKAAQVYKKILRKNSIKEKLRKQDLAKINFDLGYLYAELNLINLAIESFAEGSGGDIAIKIDSQPYFKNNFEIDKLSAVGLLEAGRWDMAIEEFKKLEQNYRVSSLDSLPEVKKYIDTAVVLKGQGLIPGHKTFLFLIGDAYIQHQLYKEARAFFTKRILDYGIKPLGALGYLQKQYGKNTPVIEKVWGDDIYVTLEDFETLEIQLSNWINNISGKVYSHYITDEASYKGYYSEFFDIAYALKKENIPAGNVYLLVKIVNIPLGDSELRIGIRLFIKSINPPAYHLCFNTIYPKSGTSGITHGIPQYYKKVNKDGGWEEYRTEDLFEAAKFIASPRNWSTEEIMIDKIIIDTKGISRKFFVDEIELFLVNQSQ